MRRPIHGLTVKDGPQRQPCIEAGNILHLVLSPRLLDTTPHVLLPLRRGFRRGFRRGLPDFFRHRQRWIRKYNLNLIMISALPVRFPSLQLAAFPLLAQEAGVRIGSSQQQTVLQGNGRHSQISLATDFSNERQISLDHRALG